MKRSLSNRLLPDSDRISTGPEKWVPQESGFVPGPARNKQMVAQSQMFSDGSKVGVGAIIGSYGRLLLQHGTARSFIVFNIELAQKFP